MGFKNSIKRVARLPIFLFINSTLLLSSCGFFDDTPLDGIDVYQSNELSAGCRLDPNSLSRILSENIAEQLRCLEENFEKFILYVRRENQDYINENELGALIRRFFHENSETIINALQLVFEINMILLHDERDRMSTGNVGPIFELLQRSNIEAVTITKILSDLTQESYWLKRQDFQDSIRRMQSTTLEIISKRRGEQTEINLREFLEELSRRIPNFEMDNETIQSILLMKMAFVGGDEEILTSEELSILVQKLPDLVMAGLDLYFVSEKNFPSNQKWLLFEFYADRVQAIEDTLAEESLYRNFVTTQRLIDIAKEIAPDSFNIGPYIAIFESFKNNLIGGNPDYYSFGDVKTASLYIKIFLQGLALVEEYKDIQSRVTKDTTQDYLESYILELQERTNYRVSLIQQYIDHKQLPPEIKLKDFIIDVVNSTDGVVDERLNINFTPELVRAAFSIKKAFLGGDKGIITPLEMEDFFSLLPFLLSDVFGLTDVKSHHFDKSREWSLHIFKILERIKEQYLFDFKRSSPTIISVDEILTLAQAFFGQSESEKENSPTMDFSRFRPTFEELKERIIGGPRDIFDSQDLYEIISLVENVLKRVYFFDVYYEANEALLKTPTQINRIPLVYRPELENLKRDEVNFFREDFENIAKTFRYFRDDSGYSYYGRDFRRSKSGFIEAAIINWISEVLLEAFDESQSGGLSIDEVDYVLHVFRPVLEELNFWSKHMETFARNTLLLSDLFQSTSNGSLEIDVNEFTEFGSLTLMSMNVAKQILDHLKAIHYERLDYGLPSSCYYEEDEDGSLMFPVPCYRQHFYEVIFYRIGLKENLPQFYQYYNTTSRRELNTYLQRVEGFARDFPDDSIPMSYRDFAKLFGALLNIESTFNRFDFNGDNIVDRDELDEAFLIYEDAIMAVADLGENRRKYSKSIFLYMVHNMEIPSTIQLLNFHYNPFSGRNIVASRLNIGVLLYYLTSRGED